MKFIADLHVHSKYSRATSRDMVAETLAKWAELKGIGLLGTGDFTHPSYLAGLKEKLKPLGNGLFTLKSRKSPVNFMLTAEVSNIYHHKDKLRKIHTMFFAPSFEVVDKINLKLSKLGKLTSDGRPIFTFPAKDLVKMILDISDRCLIVPAHAWTPWFSIFGANSGFDSIEECFGEDSKYIHCIETGLSSDPQMNWRVSALDKICLISNSDAHSPSKIGREANVFDCNLDYDEIMQTIKAKDKKKFLFTIEFFPEEGKYHFDGHRNCGILFSPKESKKHSDICPVCHRKLTVGVMHRIEDLADREEGFVPQNAIPSQHLIPLQEIIAEALGQGVNTKAVENEYLRLVGVFGSEFDILLDISLDDLSKKASSRVVEGVGKMRRGNLKIVPGHDGVFGKVSIFGEGRTEQKEEKPDQLQLF